MQTRRLGRTGLQVSALSFGASALGGVFRAVDEPAAIAAVHAALDGGINYFDVAPAYGATRSEAVLGRALQGIPRERYLLSTKVGKLTSPTGYGQDTLDYSRDGIRASLAASAARLGTDYFDIVHLHDIEYQGRQFTEWALAEGLAALHELKAEGRIGAVSFGIYPVDLWQRILRDCAVDAGLVHNHLCLSDTRLLDLLPLARARDIGLINASPFASGLLTERGAADWHPATAADRAVFQRAADFCRHAGTSIAQLAFQFSSQHPGPATTMFSTADAASVARNLAWFEQPADAALVQEVRSLLTPVTNKDWF
jgi:L-galactose dehydrogenase